MWLAKSLLHFVLGILYGIVAVGALFMCTAVFSLTTDEDRVDTIMIMLGLGPVLIVILIGTIFLHLASERWLKVSDDGDLPR